MQYVKSLIFSEYKNKRNFLAGKFLNVELWRIACAKRDGPKS